MVVANRLSGRYLQITDGKDLSRFLVCSRIFAVKHRQAFPTPIQNLALNLVFEVMGEDRENRTAQEYEDIAARLPPLKVLEFEVNKRLQALHTTDRSRLYEICRFKAGDERHTYEPLPTEISYETLRAALRL